MKKILTISLGVALVAMASCGGNKEDGKAAVETSSSTTTQTTSDYDPHRGEGKWSADNVGLGTTPDPAKVEAGKKVAEVKCFSCHKTTDEKLVGPGWKEVTNRNKPEWIMNFITNPDPMIDKDPKVQAQLEICLVRMPNQSLTDDDAKNLVEFMRANDAAK